MWAHIKLDFRLNQFKDDRDPVHQNLPFSTDLIFRPYSSM